MTELKSFEIHGTFRTTIKAEDKDEAFEILSKLIINDIDRLEIDDIVQW